jgi:Holliday junction resolvasome RuvABC endonuclease subunit
MSEKREIREQSILSIDPGTAISGVVVISMAGRLLHREIWKGNGGIRPISVVHRLSQKYNLRVAAIEDQYFSKNIKSMKRLARTSGNWEEACLYHKLGVRWVNPRTWQAAIIGKGAAKQRDQIDRIMRMIAEQDTGEQMSSDEAAAWCIGRYTVTELQQTSIFNR